MTNAAHMTATRVVIVMAFIVHSSRSMLKASEVLQLERLRRVEFGGNERIAGKLTPIKRIHCRGIGFVLNSSQASYITPFKLLMCDVEARCRFQRQRVSFQWN